MLLMANELRVGVIGCGSISRHHVFGYLHSGRYEVAALADLNESAMREIDSAFGLSTKHYPGAEEMLDHEGLDVVSVCTWHAGHATWTIAAASRRPKAILCEKPMADTIGRAD